MRFQVQHAALSRGLSVVAHIVPARTPMPVLTGILLQAEGSELVLTATDLEVGAQVRVPAEVDEPGAAVLPARYLTELVRRIPGGLLAWETGAGDGTRVRWQRSDFSIRGFAVEDFPEFPAFPDERWPFDKARLREALRQTLFAASTDLARPVLTGVEVTFRDGEVRALATDGLRVAHHRSDPLRDDWEAGTQLLVPARALAEILRCLGDEGGEGYWATRGNQLLVESGEVRLAARLLEGRYPAVLELLPKAYPTVVHVDREAFRDACERVSVVSDTPDRLYAVTVSVGDGSVLVSAEAPDVGQAREEVPAETRGQPLSVVFNARLLLEGLRHFSGEGLVLEFSGSDSAARLGDGQGRQEYVQMPIKVG
jgi:DNA polymerase-3 subunit beta